jgi:hypothetical protein
MSSAALKISRPETTRKTVRKAKPKISGRKLARGEKIRAAAFFSLACAGLTVSLPHLASEVYGLTGAGAMAAWFLAIVIDLGMIATKAHLSAHGANKGVAWSIVGSCTLVSIVLNCHAFLAHATQGFGTVAAVGFGVFLPLFILALSYMGSEILNRKQ